MSVSILVVDDEKFSRVALEKILQKWPDFVVTSVPDGKSAIEHFENEGADVVLLDLFLPDIHGFDVLEAIEKTGSTISIIVTGYGELDYAVQAMRLGAFDFIVKPITVEKVELAINRAMETNKIRKIVEIEQILRSPSLMKMIGDSKVMNDARELISKAAADGIASVLITGESGTGKELAARAIHEGSPRAKGPFVPVNCAAIPESLLESELFGHVKGAFTGANKSRRGLFTLAEGGSVLLDEIGEMSPTLQAKLLRFLDDGMVMPVGGTKLTKTDVRIISATNRDLNEEVQKGSFREDLMYRLSVVNIELPPVRERKNDIIQLMEHFLTIQSSIRGLEPPVLGEEAKAALLGYSWPGNVRQLLNLAVKLVIEAHGRTVRLTDLPSIVGIVPHEVDMYLNDNYESAKKKVMKDFTVRYFTRLLAQHGGNITSAAKHAGIERSYLHRLIKKFEITD